MSGFSGFMKKTATRTIVILLVCLLATNIPGFFALKVSAANGPDLIVQDIVLSPVNPAIGDTVSITVTIKNQGNAGAGTSYVTCYIDNNILNTASVSALDAGIMATAAFTWEATQGTHIVKATADVSEIITETDETNNTCTYSITTLAPDLIIQLITWSPASPSGGETVTFSIVIKNQGNVQSRYTSVNFYIDAVSRGTQDVGIINPGASLTKTYTWIALTGEHTLKAAVDEADNNKESDETNNELTVFFTTGSLDLAFKTVAWAPQNPSKNDTVNCTVTVINHGEGNANSWALAYFVDGRLMSTISGTPLGGGASANVTFSWLTVEDKHDIKIILDYYNQLNETDEMNNEYNVTITTLLPDLVISNITWLPVNPGAGEEVTFTAIIKNQGSGRAAASRAACYIDNQFISYLTTPILNASEETTVTFKWQSTAGTHYIKFMADFDDVLNEDDRDNNDTTAILTVAYPDLIIQNISWSPEDAYLDETVTFTVNITNQGAGRALNFYVACFMDDALLTTRLITRLEAGASVNATCQWKVLNGRHTFKAIVNYNNYMMEDDKTNNENSVVFSPKLPDLAVTSITWSPADIPAGQNVIFNIAIENQGLISAAPSRVAFYVDGAIAGYVDIVRLEPGTTTQEYFTWAASDGSHTISINLDANNQIAEIDEINNTTIINIPLPDLIVENITFSPPDISVGDNLTITALVKNQGNGVTVAFQINFYVDGVKIDSRELPPLDSGESSEQAFKWATEVGIHTFKITVDVNNTVIEVNETNNEMTLNHAAAAPDLIIEGMSWIMSDQMNSNEATFTITVRNTGNGAAGESQVSYAFDDSPADVKDIAAISAGETAEFSFIAILSTGQHTVTIIADSEEMVVELDENNNQSVVTFSTIAPDLVVRTISYTPLDADIGDTITFTVKLENRGISKATNVRLSLSIDGSVVDYEDLPEIDLATSATVEFQWVVTEGEHEITAFIDSEQANIESNEQNNTKTRTVSFAPADAPVETTANNHSTANASDGGFIGSYWWMLLLLAGLLCASAFFAIFRAIRKK